MKKLPTSLATMVLQAGAWINGLRYKSNLKNISIEKI